MKEESKKKKILKVSGLIGLFLLVFGLSYALFTVTLNGTKKVKIKTGKLELQLLDKNNNPIYITDQNNTTSYEINLDEQVPVSDEVGLDSTAFEFKLKNTGNIKASYTIYLDDVALDDGETRIDDEYIRYSLTKNGSEESPRGLSSRELDKGTIEANNTTNTYTLKIWIAEDATNEAMDKVFNATLRVEGIQYVQTGPFEDGTFASILYKKGIVGEYDATTNKIPNGFDVENETDGLIKYTDAEGTETYAYRGLNPDNNVTFAGQTWRILRIQDDGTVKLIRVDAINYVNDMTLHNYEERTEIRYNISNNNNDYSKYSNSNIESYVNEWYATTMTSYNDRIALNDYCSDRYEPTEASSLRTAVFSEWAHLYGIYNRVTFINAEDNSTFRWSPSVSCINDDIVNARVALITADECILSSGWFDDGNDYFLVKDDYYAWWTMSGAGLSYEYGHLAAQSYYITGEGRIDYRVVDGAGAVVPVITLKANVTPSSGDGSELTPYVIG